MLGRTNTPPGVDRVRLRTFVLVLAAAFASTTCGTETPTEAPQGDETPQLTAALEGTGNPISVTHTGFDSGKVQFTAKWEGTAPFVFVAVPVRARDSRQFWKWNHDQNTIDFHMTERDYHYQAIAFVFEIRKTKWGYRFVLVARTRFTVPEQGQANVAPTASFSFTCTDLSCQFDGSASTDPDGTIAGYAWDFGDGNTGTGASASQTFGSAGTYDVQLTVTDDQGATGAQTQQVTVTAANQAPVANFTVSCTDLDCSFDGSASSDPDGSIAGYAWDFGDGATSTGATTTHSYGAAGTFDVSLTVTDDQGATGSMTQQVTVMPANQSPTASFTTSCTDLDCSFDGSASSDPDGSIANYAWDFGDGATASGSTATHTYAAAGTYSVTLVVTDDMGSTGTSTQQVTVTAANQAPTASFSSNCVDLDCMFDGSTSSDPDGSIAAYAWDFGDGSTTTGATPSHSFTAAGTYDVALTVTDDLGATGSVTQQVTVTAPNQAPTASFAASCSDLDCTFDGSASSDPDGTIANYSWDFGDGGTASGATPAYSYGAAGTYTVTLTVTDDQGATGSDQQQVTVTSPPSGIAQLGADIIGEAAGDRAGWEVEMSDDGSRVAIGAPENDDAANQAGHIRVYEWNGAAWVQLGQDIDGDPGITSAQVGSERTFDLSGDGTRLAVGTWRFSAARGRVQVFELVGSSWVQVGGDISSAPGQDHWGESVALSTNGSRVAVGAPNTNGPGGANVGAAYVFELQGGTWTALGSPVLGNSANDDLGISVALSGNGSRLVAGADGDDGAGTNAGVLRVFDWNGAQWTQVGGDIQGDGLSNNERLGRSVAISRDGTRVAGAAGPSGSGGYVRVYQLAGSTWSAMGSRFNTPYNNNGKLLALSADGSRLVLGQPTSGSPSGRGAVQVFDWSGGWSQVAMDVFGDDVIDQLGHAVSISADGSRIVAGIPGDDALGSGTGATRVYTVP